MLNRLAAVGLSALVALSPLVALAETDQQLAQAAPAARRIDFNARPDGVVQKPNTP